MRLKNQVFAVVSVLGWLQSSLVVANTAADDSSYYFVASQPLSLSPIPDSGQSDMADPLLFKTYLMTVDGNQPVVLSGPFDRTHTMVNQQFNKLFHRIDEFLGEGPTQKRSNQSWARIRLDTVNTVDDGPQIKAAIKLRVVLPRAEKRFRLLFSTDDEQTNGGSTTQAARAGDPENDGFSLALRFIRQARDNGSLDFDLGTRYRDRAAQIFGRVNFLFAHDLSWNFRSRFSNSLYYYSASGYENKFRYDLTRPITGFESWLLRGSTELYWEEGRDGALISETVGLYSDIDDNRSVAVEGLALYTTVLSDTQTDKLLSAEFRVRFRHNIWRRWFFYEVWPTMSWEPVNNYQPSFGGMVRLEMVVGKY